MRQFGDCLKIRNTELEYYLSTDTYDYIKRFERDHDLSRFYQSVRTVEISILIKDVNFFNKFNRCEALHFLDLNESPSYYFKSVDLFARVDDMVFLVPDDGSTYGNEIFDLLPKYCVHLMKLTIQNTNKINFNFVHRLVGLKSLFLRLCFPIEHCEFMQMIRTLKYLEFVDIAYVTKSADSIRNELIKLKTEVNDCLANERPAIEFKIEIHTKNNVGTFIRYALRPKKLESFLMDDEHRMFKMCHYVSMNSRLNRSRLR